MKRTWAGTTGEYDAKVRPTYRSMVLLIGVAVILLLAVAILAAPPAIETLDHYSQTV